MLGSIKNNCTVCNTRACFISCDMIKAENYIETTFVMIYTHPK